MKTKDRNQQQQQQQQEGEKRACNDLFGSRDHSHGSISIGFCIPRPRSNENHAVLDDFFHLAASPNDEHAIDSPTCNETKEV